MTPGDGPSAEQRIAALERELAGLRAELAAGERRAAELRRRATFPEQNPNLVIELDRSGRVTYLNPEAEARVPDLVARAPDHPLLSDFSAIVARFGAGEVDPIVREVAVGPLVFEQKWCPTYADEALVVRLFAHDVTARTAAERAIQDLARRVITAQEEERHRISRELHDEAGQSLTALKISLQLVLDELPPAAAPAARDLARAVALVDATRERMRALARGLRPPALDAVGLTLGLEDVCRSFAEHTGLDISYRADRQVDPVPDVVSVCLYRLLQEALTNAARHAEPRHVAVALSRRGEILSLTVADDGRGFDPGDPAARRGLGLRGMTERLDLLGGTLAVHSSPGAGTRVEARVPAGGAP